MKSLWILALPALLVAQPANHRWTVILTEPALAGLHATSGRGTQRSFAESQTAKAMVTRHQEIGHKIQSRGIQISGSTTHLLNSFFIHATGDQAESLRSLPGVARVQPQRRYTAKMAKALELVNAPAAWAAVGGEANAGAGILIGVIDSGIDPLHPALQDSTLPLPNGFPKCGEVDCSYTSNKVIVARSYIGSLALNADSILSRPDDLSPRDHIGHGTAVAAVAAGLRVPGPAGSTGGVAPKAYLGNYKVFGTPGVNDDSDPSTFDEAVIQAVDDAFTDGVDIVVMALGAPALWGASDSGATCSLVGAIPCDALANAVETAVQSGMLVVAAAGNDGQTGSTYPAYGTINSPAIAPSAIAVGSTTNSHYFVSTLNTLGAPASLQKIGAQLSNGLKFQSKLTAVVSDAGGTACSPLAAGSLSGAIALIQRGDCPFFDKLTNAQQAGAIAAIVFQLDGYDGLFPLDGVATAGIPAVLIGNTSGRALQNFIAANAPVTVTIDPALTEVLPSANPAGYVADFTSWGPTIVDNLLKPEVVAPGKDLYIASQNYDPNGALYHPSRFYSANGTSFSAAMVAGAAALVLQEHPKWTPGQVKSAVVNTAAAGTLDLDARANPYQARILATGAGKLNVSAAVDSTLSVEPSTVSFGVLKASLPTRPLALTNLSSTAQTLRFQVQPAVSSSRTSVSVPASVTIAAGQSATIQVALQGSFPSPGSYDGVIAIAGSKVALRVPYFFIVGDGVPYNGYALGGDQFVLSAETSSVRLSLKAIDQYGAPIVNQNVLFGPLIDGDTVDLATQSTDATGIAEASVTLGPTLGYQGFTGQVGNVLTYFEGRARLGPQINTGGVVNAASNRAEANIAPGSLITIYGSGLADASRAFDTPYLPWSLAGASVSFYSAVRRNSYPGRLVSASDGAIVVQVPWDLGGLSDCTMKVSYGYYAQTDSYQLGVGDASPAVFEQSDPAGGTVATAFDDAGSLVTSAHPIDRGARLRIAVNGLGPVAGATPLTGEPVADPGLSVKVVPTVTIQGLPAQVSAATLWPGPAGYYQLIVIVPKAVDPGPQPIIVTAGDNIAKSVITYIQ